MKKRNIPYGYMRVQGAVIAEPAESKILHQMCQWYLAGKSLHEIAETLNQQKVIYAAGKTGWNRSRVGRLLTDRRYLGEQGYPQLVANSVFENIQANMLDKNTQKYTKRNAGIYTLPVALVCGVCGEKLQRQRDLRRKQAIRWSCTCGLTVHCDDKKLLSTVTDLLNQIIAQPETIEIEEPQEIQVVFPQILPYMDLEKAKEQLIQTVVAQYQSIIYNPIGKQIKAVFAQAKPLSAFSADLCEQTLSAISLHKNGEIQPILKNGQTIGKEIYANNHATPKDSTDH